VFIHDEANALLFLSLQNFRSKHFLTLGCLRSGGVEKTIYFIIMFQGGDPRAKILSIKTYQ
jgi:hypothetical protein